MKRLLSGLQPSGELTIGNYCGSIKQFLRYQEEYESFIFVPDMHAITVTQDPELLHQRIKKVVGLYLACGLAPEKNHFYIQSENLYHANLSWILECHSYMGEMARMTQFKDKSKKEESTTCGLFTYPLLMAADILLYSAEVVPTGADQKQHVELARNVAIRFNHRYGDTFVVPEPLIPEIGAKIRDLQEPEKKMSKSTQNPKASIFLMDDEKAIRKKIMGAKTDNDSKVCFDEENKPGISNLLTLYCTFGGGTMEEACARFADAGYGELKKEVADRIVAEVSGIQDRYREICNGSLIDDVLDAGRDFSLEIARAKYDEVRRKVGFGR